MQEGSSARLLLDKLMCADPAGRLMRDMLVMDALPLLHGAQMGINKQTQSSATCALSKYAPVLLGMLCSFIFTRR